MKNSKYPFSLLIMSLLLAPLSVFGFQDLANDPTVKIGKLDNGFTYYLKDNTCV